MERQILIGETYENKYEHYEHSVGTLMFHLEWCTKYRFKMFNRGENIKLLEACIRRSASRNEIKIIELNVQPEHIHCIVLVKFTMSVSKVLQILKGGSARLYFERKRTARWCYPKRHLWSRGKFASSVGFVQLDVVQNYVKNQ